MASTSEKKMPSKNDGDNESDSEEIVIRVPNFLLERPNRRPETSSSTSATTRNDEDDEGDEIMLLVPNSLLQRPDKSTRLSSSTPGIDDELRSPENSSSWNEAAFQKQISIGEYGKERIVSSLQMLEEPERIVSSLQMLAEPEKSSHNFGNGSSIDADMISTLDTSDRFSIARDSLDLYRASIGQTMEDPFAVSASRATCELDNMFRGRGQSLLPLEDFEHLNQHNESDKDLLSKQSDEEEINKSSDDGVERASPRGTLLAIQISGMHHQRECESEVVSNLQTEGMTDESVNSFLGPINTSPPQKSQADDETSRAPNESVADNSASMTNRPEPIEGAAADHESGLRCLLKLFHCICTSLCFSEGEEEEVESPK